MSLLSARATKAVADVTRRKGRTLLVVLGILIGVLGLTGINFTEDTIFSAYAYSAGNATNHTDIILRVDHLDAALSPALAAVPNVVAVQQQSVFMANWRISAAPGTLLMSLLSYPTAQPVAITPYQLTSGHEPGVGEVVLEYGDQDLQPVSLGDRISLETDASTVVLRVAGFARTAGLTSPAQSGEARGYLSEAGMDAAFGAFAPGAPPASPAATAGASPAASPTASPAATAPPGVAGGRAAKVPQLQHEIALRVRQLSQAATTIAAVTAVVQSAGITVLRSDVAVAFDQHVLAVIGGVFALLRILALLAVAISGLLIFNTITTLVAEQTPIIGTMKAIGGTRGAILRGYLATILLYSVLGTVPGVALGLALGWPLGSYLASTIPLDVGPFAVAGWIVPLSLAVGFGVPLLAALLPLWLGTCITVRAALAAYGISAGEGGGGGLAGMAGITRWLPWVSQTTWLGLRGLFRRRWRAALTLLVLALAGASFLVVQTASVATNRFIAGVYASYTYDIAVDHVASLSPAQVVQATSQVGALPGVRYVEPTRSLYAVSTTWGQVQLLGFQLDTQVYHPQLLSGRWLAADDTDAVLISDDLAAASGLGLGDSLTLSSGHGRVTLTIVGILRQATANLGPIGVAVTTIANVNRAGGDPSDLVDSLLVQTSDHAPAATNQLTSEINQQVSQIAGGSDFAVTAQSVIQRAQRGWYIFYALLYGVALIVGLVGILGLTNALTTSVLERRREIGMLRAMGASGWRVARVFWTEGLALGGIAWCAGVLVGLPLAYGFIQLMGRLILRVAFTLDPSALLVMLAAILVIATLASILPALRAARVRPAELLRYE